MFCFLELPLASAVGLGRTGFHGDSSFLSLLHPRNLSHYSQFSSLWSTELYIAAVVCLGRIISPYFVLLQLGFIGVSISPWFMSHMLGEGNPFTRSTRQIET